MSERITLQVAKRVVNQATHITAQTQRSVENVDKGSQTTGIAMCECHYLIGRHRAGEVIFFEVPMEHSS